MFKLINKENIVTYLWKYIQKAKKVLEKQTVYIKIRDSTPW